jgi:hypothetical protein
LLKSVAEVSRSVLSTGEVDDVAFPLASNVLLVVLPLPSVLVVSSRVPPLAPPAVVLGSLSCSEVRVVPVNFDVAARAPWV